MPGPLGSGILFYLLSVSVWLDSLNGFRRRHPVRHVRRDDDDDGFGWLRLLLRHHHQRAAVLLHRQLVLPERAFHLRD